MARAALEKHGEDIIVMDVRSLSSVADFFVICTAFSARQVAALKEHIERALAQNGCTVWHAEGMEVLSGPARGAQISSRKHSSPPDHSSETGQMDLVWVLMDCGDVVIHLQDPAARSCYQLERLWADAPRVPIEPMKLLDSKRLKGA